MNDQRISDVRRPDSRMRRVNDKMANGRWQMAKQIPHSTFRSFPLLGRLGKCGQAVEAATVVPELALGASSLGSSGPGLGNLAQDCFRILAVECRHSRSGEIFRS